MSVTMRAYDIAAATPWAIQEEVLRDILRIAAREDLNPEAVAAKLGRPLDNARRVTTRDDVAVIPVRGVISRYMNLFSEISGGTSIQVLATDFNEALDNPTVGSIIFDIDSPGGEVVGVGEFAEMVYQARGKKRIVAYVGGVGASAAYWLASAADEVVAAPTAPLGSIGIVMAYRDRRVAEERAGVKTVEFVSSQSPNKRPDLDTEAGKSQIQQMVDDLAAVFVADVARNRNVTTGTVLIDYGAGGVLIGQKAVDAGLADRLGSLEGLIEELTDVAGRGSLARRALYGGNGASAQAGEGGDGMSKETEAAKKPSRWDRFMALLKDEGEPAEAAATATEPAPAAPAAPAAAAPDPQRAVLEQKLAAEREKRIAAEAAAFVATVQDRTVPAERPGIQAAFIQAAMDDETSPLATGSRVGLLKAAYEKRPAHRLTEELLAANGATAEQLAAAQVLENAAETETHGREKPLTPERRQELLGHTPLGRAVLDNGKGGK